MVFLCIIKVALVIDKSLLLKVCALKKYIRFKKRKVVGIATIQAETRPQSEKEAFVLSFAEAN